MTIRRCKRERDYDESTVPTSHCKYKSGGVGEIHAGIYERISQLYVVSQI